MELDKFQILIGETSTGNHCHTIASTCVRRRAAEVGSTIATGGQHGVLGKESVESAIFLIVSEDATALAVLHDQVESEELDEVVCVVSERLAVERMKKGVTGPIGDGTASVCLATLAVLLRLATESALVAGVQKLAKQLSDPGLGAGSLHLSVFGSREGAAVVLQLNDGCRGLPRHVVDGVLVAKPVGTLDGIVHVPSPVILVHVSEGGIDTALGGDGMASRGEELRYTGCVETSLGETERCPQPSTTGTNDEGIVLVVLGRQSAASEPMYRWAAEAVFLQSGRAEYAYVCVCCMSVHGCGWTGRTTTGYLLLTCMGASFALSGLFAKMRAMNTHTKY